MDPTLAKRCARLVPDQRLVYVDCGARAGAAPGWLRRSLKDSLYVGIELDPVECAALEARGRTRHRYIAAALDREPRRRTLCITSSPACCSLFEPDAALVGRFAGLATGFTVLERRELATTTLDLALREAGIGRADVLELDTQGSELDILRGAEATLRSIVAIQTEVEFAPMYRDQSLFADVDAYLRARRFGLFDLSRYHVRDAAAPAIDTRGRVLWGHALYFRDDDDAVLDDAPLAMRLAFVAAAWGFPDHAAGVLSRLDARLPDDSEHRPLVRKVLRTLQTPSRPSRLIRLLRALERRGLRRLVRSLGEAAEATARAAADRNPDVWRT